MIINETLARGLKDRLFHDFSTQISGCVSRRTLGSREYNAWNEKCLYSMQLLVFRGVASLHGQVPGHQPIFQFSTEVMMNVRKSLILGGYVLFFMSAFPLVVALQHLAFAQNPEDRSDMRDRVAIQEKLLYAYAYLYDSKDCVSWANLFTSDAVLNLSESFKANGRDAILQACIARQKNVVGSIKTRHNMTNIVFDQLTGNQAKTRTYLALTWQKPGDMTPSTQAASTYRDVIVKQSDGRWLFKERVQSLD